jgi:hypothetical protein
MGLDELGLESPVSCLLNVTLNDSIGKGAASWMIPERTLFLLGFAMG